METYSTPPPLPRLKPPGGGIGGFLVKLLVVIVVVGVVAVGIQQQERKRAALDSITRVANEERAKMADSMEKGTQGGGSSAIGRMKDQFGRSSTQLTGNDAATMQAMAKVLGKLQEQTATYQAATQRMTQAKVFAFEIPDLATLSQDREILQAFAKSNADLQYTFVHLVDLFRTELQAAKVPTSVQEAALRSYNSEQHEVLTIQLKIRASDAELGQTGLEVLDLLEKSWGRWERNATSGHLVFRDHDTLLAFNDLAKKVQGIFAAEKVEQQQLIEKARGSMKQSPRSSPAVPAVDNHPL